jgi:preprotein translocase SecE subunit
MRAMLNFFYDSLDTLKKVKKPTTKEIKDMTITIFVVVVIAAIVFVIFDTIFGELYKTFYASMTS